MNKHIVTLIILGAFTLVSGFIYKKLVYDYDFSQAKVIYEEKKQQQIFEYEDVTIFVPNKELKKLEKKAVKIRKIENQSDKIRLIFEEIRRYSDHKINYIDTSGKKVEGDYLDYATRINNSYFDGSDLYLNFNHRFQSGIETKEQELLLIYSIVNTYTSLDNIDRVKILINNQSAGMLKYYNISGFFEKDLNI